MRKLLVSEMVTLDGFFAGPNGEIDWHVTDEDFNEFAIAQLDSVDLLVFGRITYEMMVSFWPTPDAIRDEFMVADRMNKIPKLVFSKTLESTPWGEWNNARLVKDHVVEEVTRLKQQPGKDMIIFGSGSIVSLLTQHHLIDEYRIIVAPVILGRGKTLFESIEHQQSLRLLRTKTLKSGVIILFYEPVEG
jgi:dihydrofolate reductase